MPRGPKSAQKCPKCPECPKVTRVPRVPKSAHSAQKCSKVPRVPKSAQTAQKFSKNGHPIGCQNVVRSSLFIGGRSSFSRVILRVGSKPLRNLFMLLRSEDRCSEWRPGGRLSILMGYIKKRVIFLVSRSNCSVKSDSYVHFCCKTVTRRHSEIVVGRRQSSFGANILHPTNILDNFPTFMKTQIYILIL